MPKLVGRTLVDSKRLLLAGHCKVGKVKYATSKVRRKDRVIQQGRRPATTLAGGSGVTLLVSSRLIGKSSAKPKARRRRAELERYSVEYAGCSLTPRARATH